MSNTLLIEEGNTLGGAITAISSVDKVHRLVSTVPFVKLLPCQVQLSFLTIVSLEHRDINSIGFLRYSKLIENLTINRGELGDKPYLQCDIREMDAMKNIKVLNLTNIHNPKLLEHIVEMKKLECLKLVDCSFGPNTVYVDVQLGNLEHLTSLTLIDNTDSSSPGDLYNMTTTMGFSNLLNLQTLFLNGIDVDGVEFLEGMTKLTELSLINVDLPGVIDSILVLTNLTKLDIDATNEGVDDDFLRSFTKLEELAVWGGSHIIDLSFLTNLHTLQLYYSFLDTDPVDLSWITALQKLRVIDLYDYDTTIKSLVPLSHLPMLESIKIDASVDDSADINYHRLFMNVPSTTFISGETTFISGD